MSRDNKVYLLAFNAGSSSLKFELFARRPEWRPRLRGAVRDIGRPRAVFQLEGAGADEAVRVSTHAQALELVLDALLDGTDGRSLSADSLAATGHRVVHGADLYSAPVPVTHSVMAGLQSLAHLAPLHNPPSLAVMEVVRKRLAGVPMVAVFDTAFFSGMPDYVRRYAVPSSWFADYGIRRYGFHGIAHEYLRDRLMRLSGMTGAPNRVVTLHLGHGCSVAALRDGQPMETSMGFTPLEGLIMGTRPGDLDSGTILHMQRQGHSWERLEEELNRESGLRGLSGVSDDVRELLALADTGHAGATLALAAFCHRIHKYLGAYAAVLGGIDALVFGGGIGENAPAVRSRICEGLKWLGLELDEEANARCSGTEQRVSTPSSAIEVYVVPVREEEAIARAALACLETGDTRSGLSSSKSFD